MGYEGPAIGELLDGDALRRALTALAQASTDKTKLRAEALGLIKGAFQDGRARVKAEVEDGTLSGLAAARALSNLQDATIQVIYDFATKHFFATDSPFPPVSSGGAAFRGA